MITQLYFHFNDRNYYFKLRLQKLIYQIHNQILTNKILVQRSAQMIFIAAIFAFIPTMIHPNKSINSDASFKLDTTKRNLLLSSNGNVQIVPGDSAYDSELKAQAAAQANALAKSSVKIASTVYNDPSNFDPIYKSAGAQFNVSWQILKAVHYVETGCSGSTSKTSYAGATGPMQFMQGTWRAYGVDGNGDGVADIHNVVDAIYGAANLLSHAGAAENIDNALLCYNHSMAYVHKVKEVASSIN